MKISRYCVDVSLCATIYTFGNEDKPKTIVLGNPFAYRVSYEAILRSLTKKLKDMELRGSLHIVSAITSTVPVSSVGINLLLRSITGVINNLKKIVGIPSTKYDNIVLLQAIPGCIIHTIILGSTEGISSLNVFPTKFVGLFKGKTIENLLYADFADHTERVYVLLFDGDEALDLEVYRDALNRLLLLLYFIGHVKRISDLHLEKQYTVGEIEIIRAPISGIWYPIKRSGTQLVEDEVIGFIDEDYEIKAPCDGIMLCCDRVRIVGKNDVIAIVLRTS